MSEFPSLLPARNVLEVSPAGIENPFEQKALFAMQASALRGTEAFTLANSRLIRVAGELSLAPTVTYEDLVFVNPIDQGPYVMSGESGFAEQESLFYRAHSGIEEHLATAISELTAGKSEASVASILSAIKGSARLYRQLEPEAFKDFRQYFIGLNDLPGASGMFTASIPILDFLSHGGVNRNEEHRVQMMQDIDQGLYPAHQAPELTELLLAEDPKVDIMPYERDEIRKALKTFRGVHKASVGKFMPKGSVGSGGIDDFNAFLDSMMEMEMSELEAVVV